MQYFEEMIDVVDQQGMFTGETLPKSQVHAGGKWHECVHGIITDGRGNVLVQFRGPDVKLMRNVWDVMGVAGHISAVPQFGDDLEPRDKVRDLIQRSIEALIREFQEEIDVRIARSIFFTQVCRLIGVSKVDQPTEDGWMDRTLSVNWLMVLPDLDPSQFTLEPGKVLDVRWVRIDEVEAALAGHSDMQFAVREPDNQWLMRAIIAHVRLAMSGV
jgi:8-oxo-dGTP pyrophosphatase MutT (NUDIX family)